MTWQLLVEGKDPQQRAKQRLEPSKTYVLGRSADCDIPIAWDIWLSRQHVKLEATSDGIKVSRLKKTSNPIYFDGNPSESFTLAAGQRFVIGETSFLLRELQPMSPLPEHPVQEISFSHAELQQVVFEDADRRMEALARLPGVIAMGLNQEEQHSHLASLILAGIRHAEAVAIVSLDAKDAVHVLAWERRTETHGSFRPSVGLVRDAMHGGHSVLHVWEKNAGENSEYTVQSEFDWSFCTPVARRGQEQWGVYVAGQLDQPLHETHPMRRNLQSDVRFAQLIGEVIGSSERTNRMEGQLSILRQFLSPPILKALEETGRNGELNAALLQPRVCSVTVLFCDLRGFSQHAEEMMNDLQGLLARVNGALEIMTTGILNHGGVTGDFLGDAVLGFWGWPFPSEDAPLKACRAALEIRREFLKIQRNRDHALSDFRVGIGVAHGQAVAGKIGTGGRVSVTVFGPVVNLASRLEGMTKRLHVPIILDEATAQLAREGLSSQEGRLRQLATVRPYGMETPLTVSELLPPEGEFSDLSDAHVRKFEEGVKQFTAGRWEEAYRSLHEVSSSDQAQDFLLALITQHNRSAPQGWRGIVELSGK
ncbi:adenylate/guanylate cyclase domain-containing protein [Planctomicrobium sp. SH661]|uniref:adenylate/guanylate cyclase domain-containing protein n=1 Tax=Planctomicrobium sp. SH661 TaxID=3448124 RepID=UPI003F5B76E5